MAEARVYSDLVAIVETWATKRLTITQGWDNGASRSSLEEFVATHNAMTRRLISELGRTDPPFYSALMELANNVETIAAGRKVFIDGADVTNSTWTEHECCMPVIGCGIGFDIVRTSGRTASMSMLRGRKNCQTLLCRPNSVTILSLRYLEKRAC